MKQFVSDKVHDQPIVDMVFEASQGAQRAISKDGAGKVVNGAFGAFFTDGGELLTFDSVYRTFDAIPDVDKARYAASISGAPEFKRGVKQWLFTDAGVELDAEVVATPGGTGALSSTVKNVLAPGEIVVHPDIGWGPYKTIARQHQIGIEHYTLFDGQRFNLDSFQDTCRRVMKRQGKLLVFVNDPCQNPTGYTLEEDEWDRMLEILETISSQGPVVLLLDIAYIDFTHLGMAYRRRFEKLKHLGENLLTVIAFSASKTMTAYGMRVGAQVIISNNEEGRRQFKNACENTCRGIWSTVNNGGMRAFGELSLDAELKAAYTEEKRIYLKLLKDRASRFTSEADAVGLPIYPYKEGFFITLRIDDADIKNALYERLMARNIFFVNVYGGLRIAICSIPTEKLDGLARKVKETLEEIESEQQS